MFSKKLKAILKSKPDALCFVLIIGSSQDDKESSHTNQSLPIFAQQIASSEKEVVVANFDNQFNEISDIHDGNLHVYKSIFKVPHALHDLEEAANALNKFISTNVNKKLVIIDHTSPSAYSARQLYSQLTIKNQALLIVAYYAWHPAVILDENTASLTGNLDEYNLVNTAIRYIFNDSLTQDELELLKSKSMVVCDTNSNSISLFDQGIMVRKTIIDDRAMKVTFKNNWQIFFSINTISQEHIFPSLRASAGAAPTRILSNGRGLVTSAETMAEAINFLVLFILEHQYMTASLVSAIAICAVILTITTCGLTVSAAGTCAAAFIAGGVAGGFTLFATSARAQNNVDFSMTRSSACDFM